MKLLLDTNILLDCMVDRKPYAESARKLLILGALGELSLWMSPSQFTDAFYLLTEGGKPRLAESTKLRLLKVKQMARICALDEDDIEGALQSSWPDFEDACLYECAQKLNVEAIITRNARDFERSSIPIFDCTQFFTYLRDSRGIDYEEISF